MPAITTVLQSERTKQFTSLYGAMILQLALSVVTSILTTRFLGPKEYGDYTYLNNVFTFGLLIITTGHFYSLQSMLASTTEPKKILSAGLLYTVIISIAFVLLVNLFILGQDMYAKSSFGHIIRYLSIVLLFFPLQNFLESSLTGLNKIYELSILKIAPRFLYVLFIVAYWKYYSSVNGFAAILLQLLTFAIVSIVLLWRLKIPVEFDKYYFKHIETENKKYGFHVYLGALSGVALAQLCTLAIAYISGNVDLGLYNLALLVSSPLGMIPLAIATIMFKRFSESEVIPSKVTKITIAISAAALVIFMLLMPPVVKTFYGHDFQGAIQFSYYLAFASIIHGFGDFYNRFLSAKFEGKGIRNGAIATGLANVLGFIIFVPFFGVLGVAFGRLFGDSVYFGSMYWAYKRKSLRTTDHNNIPQQ